MSQPISPAIIINERFDARPEIPVGYNVLCMGFTSEGVANEPFVFNNLSEFIEIFGEPDPSREEQIYSYESAKRIIETGANLVFVKLPYGAREGFDVGDEFSALVYPALKDTSSRLEITGYVSDTFIPASDFGSLSGDAPFENDLEVGEIISPTDYANMVAICTNDFDSDLFTPVTRSFSEWEILNDITVTDLDPDIQDTFTEIAVGGILAAGSSLSDYNYHTILAFNPTIALNDITEGNGFFIDCDWIYSGPNNHDLDINVIGTANTFRNGQEFNHGLVTGMCFTNEEFLALVGLYGECDFNTELLTAVSAFTDCEGYVFGEPVRVTLSEEDYDNIECGQIDWSDQIQSFDGATSAYNPIEFGKAGMIVLDSGRSKSRDGREGYYVTVSDNSDGDPATDWDAITGIQTSLSTTGANTWEDLSEETYDFALSAPFGSSVPSISNSLSQLAGQVVNGPWEDPRHKNYLNVTLWRLTKDVQNGSDRLVPRVVETHTGSISTTETEITEGGFRRNVFISDVVEGNSNRMTVLVNPNISEDQYEGTDGQKIRNVRMYREGITGLQSPFPPVGTFNGFADDLYGISRYTPKQIRSACDVGSIPKKVRNALCTVDNPDRVTIDLSTENGLGTIWTTVKEDRDSWLTGDQRDESFCYNPHVFLDVVGDLGRSIPEGTEAGNFRTHWREVFDSFVDFTEKVRVCNGGYHHLHIADTLRQILVNGRDCKVYDSSTKCKNQGVFAEKIYWPSRNLTKGIVNTVSTIDAQWSKSSNIYSSGPVWIPNSSITAALMASTALPWQPAAGTRNGVIRNVVDIAIDPVLRDRDQLFKIHHNATFFDRNVNGFLRLADQTLLTNDNHQLKENSARRLLVWLEKNLQGALRPFLFEPNNLQTRVRFKNEIELYLNTLLNAGAIEDFAVGLSRNTPTAQQEGCLIADIAITITGIVTQIKLNLNLARLDQNFQEIF